MQRVLVTLFLIFVVQVFAGVALSQDGKAVVLSGNATQLRADHFNSSATIALVPDGTKLHVIDGSRQQFLKVRVAVNGRSHVGWILRVYTDIEFIRDGIEPDREYLKGLQRDLTRAGFYAGDIDGRQLPALAAAINRFLGSIGELPTSSLTDEQREELKMTAQRSSIRFSHLRRPVEPSKAEAVAIQRYVDQLGYQIGDIDGVIGRKTRRAIEAYQRTLGGSPTGVLTLGQILQLHRTATIRSSGSYDQKINELCGSDLACVERQIWEQINEIFSDYMANQVVIDRQTRANRAGKESKGLAPWQKALKWYMEAAEGLGSSGGSRIYQCEVHCDDVREKVPFTVYATSYDHAEFAAQDLIGKVCKPYGGRAFLEFLACQ